MFPQPIRSIVDEKIREVKGVGNVLPVLLGGLCVPLHEGASIYLAGIPIFLREAGEPLILFTNHSDENERFLINVAQELYFCGMA